MPTLDKHQVSDILLSADEIGEIVEKLAQRIRETYRDASEISTLVLLEGAHRFACDLLAALDDPRMVYLPLVVNSYTGTQSSGHVQTGDLDTFDLTDRDVLIVDDIYDSGRTLHRVTTLVEQLRPESLRTCVLLEKQRAHEETLSVDFVGRQIPDRFVVGYGLDFEGLYRELPYLATLRGV